MMSDRKRTILMNHCMGKTCSKIDKELGLSKGTAHAVITGWWLDDKLYRNGGMEKIIEDTKFKKR